MKFNRSAFAILLVTACFALAACTTVNPYTGEQQVSKLAVGSGVGALGGAAVGALTADNEDRRKHALIGAGIGAVAGGSRWNFPRSQGNG